MRWKRLIFPLIILTACSSSGSLEVSTEGSRAPANATAAGNRAARLALDWYASIPTTTAPQRPEQPPEAIPSTSPLVAAASGGAGLIEDQGYLCYGPCMPWTTPCAIPAYICERESLGFVNVKNRSSSSSGKYQAIDSTWGSYGGYVHAGQAPEAVQDQWATELWANGRGCSHWNAC